MTAVVILTAGLIALLVACGSACSIKYAIRLYKAICYQRTQEPRRESLKIHESVVLLFSPT